MNPSRFIRLVLQILCCAVLCAGEIACAAGDGDDEEDSRFDNGNDEVQSADNESDNDNDDREDSDFSGSWAGQVFVTKDSCNGNDGARYRTELIIEQNGERVTIELRLNTGVVVMEGQATEDNLFVEIDLPDDDVCETAAGVRTYTVLMTRTRGRDDFARILHTQSLRCGNEPLCSVTFSGDIERF